MFEKWSISFSTSINNSCPFLNKQPKFAEFAFEEQFFNWSNFLSLLSVWTKYWKIICKRINLNLHKLAVNHGGIWEAVVVLWQVLEETLLWSKYWLLIVESKLVKVIQPFLKFCKNFSSELTLFARTSETCRVSASNASQLSTKLAG